MKYKLKNVDSGYNFVVLGTKFSFNFRGIKKEVTINSDNTEFQKRIEELGFIKTDEFTGVRTGKRYYEYEKTVEVEEVEELYYMDIKFIFNDGEEADLELFNHEGKRYMRDANKKQKEKVLESLSKIVQLETLKHDRRPDLGYGRSIVIEPNDFSKIVKGVVGYKTSYKPECYAMDGVEFSKNEDQYIIEEEKIVLMLDEFDEAVYEKLKPNLMLEVIEE